MFLKYQGYRGGGGVDLPFKLLLPYLRQKNEDHLAKLEINESSFLFSEMGISKSSPRELKLIQGREGVGVSIATYLPTKRARSRPSWEPGRLAPWLIHRRPWTLRDMYVPYTMYHISCMHLYLYLLHPTILRSLEAMGLPTFLFKNVFIPDRIFC